MRSVSVVVPTYNCGSRLGRALRSIEAQTYPADRIEILVVDDGSTDDTADVVHEFAAQARVETRYFRQENAGPAAARNRGLNFACGDTIAFLDADDWWEPEKLARQVPLLDDAVAFVYCDCAFVDAEGRPLADYVRRVELVSGDILLALFCDFFILTSSAVLARAAINETGMFDEKLGVGEDYEFFLRLARRYHAGCVAEKLLVRCVRPDSLSRRDYALDARVDLATLENFLRDNPEFARNHRRVARRRIARYRYDFAYRLLADNRRREAIVELLRSLRTELSVGAARTLTRALFPALTVSSAVPR
ncbi:MAG TPA: glycosyltransferase family A protein [Rudaea sp.]|nr:glycosyltransferase family A protein [Rudaea sp.]